MVALTRPDTYVEESLLATSTTIQSTTSVAALVGSAKRGPVTPVKLQSWSDVVKYFGDFTGVAADDALLQGFFDTLNNGTRTCYGVRAVGAGAVAATLGFSTTNDVTVTAGNVIFTADNPGTWGNQLYVEVVQGSDALHSHIYIRLVPVGAAITNQQIVERWVDVSMNPADPRYLLNLINSPVAGSDYVTVTLKTAAPAYAYTAGDFLTPTAVGGAKLASGADGAAPTAAVVRDACYTLDVVNQPLVINLPGVTDVTTLTYVMDYIDASRTRTDGDPGRGDCFLVIDSDAGATEAVAAAKAATYPQSDCAAVYYPQIVVNDPSSQVRGATKLVPPGPAVIGRYIATDAARGVFKAPAGILDGALNGVLALDPAARLRNSDLNTLFAANINAIKPVAGRGPAVIYGMRTLKPTYITKYVNARRTLIAVRADLKQSTQFAISENNDSYLWANLFNIADRICRELHSAGGLKGATAAQAYFVVCDETNNTPTTIENGEVHLQVGLALQRPAEFMILSISQMAGVTTITEGALPIAA